MSAVIFSKAMGAIYGSGQNALLEIVKTHDVVIDSCGCFSVIGIAPWPQSLHLQVQDKALYYGVVLAIALTVHAPVFVQELQLRSAGTLVSTVAVHAQARLRLAQYQGHL